uniref:Protein jim lovell n=1 Tax=Cacopsylla melanoneura TaxID=428564 RepID=A0A8D8T9K9_9HEMI
MSSPHYSLRWNNHQSHLLTAFDSLLQNETLVDVTLVCEKSSFKAHKVVLSACSPYFQKIFSETPCKHPVIVLKDVQGWEIQAIVDFMYKGEISVGQDQITSLIKAAENLQVRGLAHTDSGPMCNIEPILTPLENNNTIRKPPPGGHIKPEMTGACFSPVPSVTMFNPHFNVDPPLSVASSMSFNPNGSGEDRHCTSPLPRRKQARPRRRSGEACGAQDLSKCPAGSPDAFVSDGGEIPENLSTKKPGPGGPCTAENNNKASAHNNNLKNRESITPSSSPTNNFSGNEDTGGVVKEESDEESSDMNDSQMQPMELTMNTPNQHNAIEQHHPRHHEFSEPISLPPHSHESIENSNFPPHLASMSAFSLTPPHMFSLDSHLGLFPGMDGCRNPLINEIMEPHRQENHGIVKKKMGRPKGQHSAPRGGPPRSWTNAELTEALQHVWNKKMTTSQASRIFGIPYNSLLMYVRGKYGKSLKLEQLKKECFGDLGGPLDLLGLGPLSSNNNNNNSTPKSIKGPEQDLMLGPPGFNPGPYPTSNFYPDFGSSFPVPVGMVHLLPQSEKNREPSPLDYAKEDARRDNPPTPNSKELDLRRESPLHHRSPLQNRSPIENAVTNDEDERNHIHLQAQHNGGGGQD